MNQGSTALEPLHMRHAEWCPLSDDPLPSVQRDITRAVQPCNCGDQLAQDSYDLGQRDGPAPLDILRRMGWTVAVHNDYQTADGRFTFWLLTHAATGRFVKGEAPTDDAAVREALDQVASQPRVVVLCGSTRFKREFLAANFELSLQGKIVLSIAWAFPEIDRLAPPSAAEKRILDTLYLRKIDLADEVVLISPDGYVGESTSAELAYARAHNKPIRTWTPQADWTALYAAMALGRTDA